MSKGQALVVAVDKATDLIRVDDAPRIAARVNARFGTNAPGTREGIVSAIRSIVRNNPGKAAIVAALMLEFGLDVGADVVSDYLTSPEYVGVQDGGAIQEAYLAARKRVTDQIEKTVGDGRAGTVLGQSDEDFEKDIGALNYQFGLIEDGIRAFGTISSFERVREALLGVEPKALEAWRRLRQRG